MCFTQVNRDIISSNDLVVVNGTVEIIPVSADTSVEISQRYHPNFPGKCSLHVSCNEPLVTYIKVSIYVLV